MNVFQIITHLDMGGAERVAINLSKSKSEGFSYYIFEVVRGSSTFSSKLKEELRKAGVTYYCSPFSNKKIAICFFWIWFIWKYIALKPNIIHVHTEIPDLALWLFRKIAWIFFWIRPQYVRTIHNTELWNKWGGIGKSVEKFYKKHHCNVAISRSTQECYIQRYHSEKPIIIYNGVQIVQQRPFPSLVKGKINVLFAGRLEPQKGIQTLVKVVESLKDNNNIHFHIIGKGSMKDFVGKTIGLQSNATLYDSIYGLNSYFGSFDYLFMPSVHEGLALMPIEASLAHTPTIINKCPGLKDTMPADWPLAVDGNSVEAFLDIFNNKIKVIDYSEVAEKAYEFAKNKFSLKQMQIAYEKLYEEKLNIE